MCLPHQADPQQVLSLSTLGQDGIARSVVKCFLGVEASPSQKRKKESSFLPAERERGLSPSSRARSKTRKKTDAAPKDHESACARLGASQES